MILFNMIGFSHKRRFAVNGMDERGQPAPINRFDSTPAHWHLYGHGSLCGPVSVRNALDMRKFPLEDRRISDDSVVPSNAS
uniref:Uncharacterized protein n=1 Tax=Ascaris lumbricoides TaxID=6252 RepID=A0A0M3HMV6_ASCLU